jgi:4-hydroxy-2-oxoheptanedioate aldolase
MRENIIKTIWQTGDASVNGWLHIPSSWSAEVMAHQGFDSLTVDLQHGLVDYQAAIPMLQAISTTNVVPLARVPWNEPGMIMKLLDAGAYGIICPMINSREECETFVGACRYHPRGYRSLGPTRARIFAGPDYAHHANQQMITMAMIETAEAVANVHEIVSVAGLDAVYVGPGDLSLTMDLAKRVDNDEPVFLAALDEIVASCRQQGIVAGIHTNDPAYARRMIAKGFQFVTIMTDTGLLGTMARQVVTMVKEDVVKSKHDLPDTTC